VLALHRIAVAQEPPVLFIDSGNCFDPHLIYSFCKDDAYEALERILVTRPFTEFQLLAALKQTASLIESHDRKGITIIISSLDSLFKDTGKRDTKKLLAEIEQLLQHLMKKFGVRCIIGRYRPTLNTDMHLTRVMIDGQDSIAAAQHSAAEDRRAQEVPQGIAHGRPASL
ncbi:MAG: hypothetical protein KJ709_03010, partial [Nanoarchaeota archaeon]|nr:hypothetical protein [Nanoarchaeota archaeon]